MSFSLILNPFQTAVLGFVVTAVFGFLFARSLRSKLLGWEQEKISPFPIAKPFTLFTWITAFSGLTLLFTSALVIYDFSLKNSFIFSLVISVSSSIVMWTLITGLMKEVEEGRVREMDEFF